MNIRFFSMRRLAYFMGFGLFLVLANGCGPSDETTPQKHQDDKGMHDGGFLKLAKACADGQCDQDALEAAYDKLDDAAIKALADEKDGDLNVTHMLVKARLEPKVVAVVGKFLNKLEGLEKAKVDEQLDHKVGGEDAMAVVRGARPSGEDAGERAQVLAYFVSLRPTKANDLKDSSNAFDAAAFKDVMAKVDDAHVKPVAEGLDTTNQTVMLTWVMANRDDGKPLFKRVYGKVEAPRQEAMRNLLLATVYPTPADVVDMLDAQDPWGVVGGINVDVYKLDANPNTDPVHEGKLLRVLVLRTMNDSDQAANVGPYGDLRNFAQAIRARMNDDAAYTALIETELNANNDADSELIKLVAGNIGGFEGYEYYYLDAADAHRGVKKAANSQIRKSRLEELYKDAITSDAAAVALASSMDNGDSFVQKVVDKAVAKGPDGRTEYLVSNFLSRIEAASGKPAAIVEAHKRVGNGYALIKLLPLADSDDLKSMIATLIKYDDGNAVKAAASDKVKTEKVLDAVLEKGDGAALKLALEKIPANRLADIGEWAGKKPLNSATGDGVTLAAAFKDAYVARGLTAANLLKLNNPLVKHVYETALTNAGGNPAVNTNNAVQVQAAVDAVASMISAGYLDINALKLKKSDNGGYAPFSVVKGKLLFTVLQQAKSNVTGGLLTQALVNGVANALKTALTAGVGALTVVEWQAYLNDSDNDLVGMAAKNKSIKANLVQPDAGGIQATAEAWLAY